MIFKSFKIKICLDAETKFLAINFELNGSVELGPIVKLSDVIVDIVETGSTLRENGLEVLEEICPLSARMIVNQVSMQMESQRIGALIKKLRELVKQQ